MPTAICSAVASCPQCGEMVPAGGASCRACGCGVAPREGGASSDAGSTPPTSNPSGNSDLTPTLPPPAAGGWTGAGATTTREFSAMPEPGHDFGPRYRIERLLGEGGMGRVYLAQDRELDRQVALKMILPALAADGEMMRRFKQELLLASRISQKNILRIHDLGEAGGVKFISMAYIEGEDLHRRLRRERKLPPEEVVRLGAQILEALAAAHEQGVIHRDLKPQNLLLDREGALYVTDFGLAKSAAATQALMTQAGAVLGTPRYMSPEQVEGRVVDARSDIYSFGLILYEMAAGEAPFAGTTALELMYQRVKTQPRDPSHANPALPPTLRRVILRCLATRPEDRYSTARAALAELTGTGSGVAAAGAHVPPQRGVTWAATPSPWRRFRAWPAALAVAILILLAGGWWFWSRPAAPPGAGNAAGAATPGSVPPLSRGKYIAILPLAQAAGGHSYLAQGIADSLSARLFSAPGVHLISQRDVRQAGDHPWSAIARAVGANLVVHGDLEQAQGQIRVILAVDNAVTGARMWAQQFSGAAADLFTLEDEIYGGLATGLALAPVHTAAAQAAAHPTENLAAYNLYLQARQILRQGQTPAEVQRAIEFYTRAAEEDPNFALAYAGLADADLIQYRQTNQSLAAAKGVAAAETAARLGPRQPEALFALGNAWRATGKIAQAIQQIQRALQLAPNSDDGYRTLGAAYLAAGKAAAALAAYQHAVQINDFYWMNHLMLGNAQFQLGHYAAALKEYQRVNQLAPGNAMGYLNAGAALLGQGQYAASIAPLEQALRLHPGSSAYSNLGFARFYLHQYAASLPLFQKAVALRPGSEEALGNLADAYRWTGQQALAHATYQKAIALVYRRLEVNPRDADQLGSLALDDAKDGHPALAAAQINRARAMNPSDLDLVYIQAVVETIGGHPRAALAALRQALKNGYSAIEARQDPELTPLHKLMTFQQLIKQYGG